MKTHDNDHNGLLHCKNCDGYYDPTLPNCPHCGEETVNNLADERWSAFSVTQYGGGFGTAGSALSRAALLITVVLLLVALSSGVVLGVQTFSSRIPGGSSPSVPVSSEPEPSASASASASVPAETPPANPTKPAQRPNSDTPSAPDEITLNYTDLTLVSGETQRLVPTISPENWKGKLTWTTDNRYIATIAADGSVTYVGGGDCHITVSAGRASASCIIRCRGEAAKTGEDPVWSVNAAYPAKKEEKPKEEPEEKPKEEPKEKPEEDEPEEKPQEEEPEEKPDEEKPEETEKGGELQLTLGGKVYTNNDFTLEHVGEGYSFSVSGGDGTYTWSSSNPSVATVDNSGNVKAVGVGRADVTCSSGGKSVTAIIRVASN